MIRTYKNTDSNEVNFFTGVEIEKTPAYGLETLFVVGLQSANDIVAMIEDTGLNIRHIFFGANHSFNPKGYSEYKQWDALVGTFLDKGYVCSLDIPLAISEEVLESPFINHNNFIPQLRVPVPYIKQWNYNTTLKIDDISFNKTNPGVWVHSLHELQSRDKFTDWRQYSNDEAI